MFEDITQLENEVKEFHKNILASQDLLNRLDSLMHAVSEEHNAVVTQTEAVNQSILEKSQAASSLLESSANEVRQSNQSVQEEFKSQADRICSSAAETAQTITASNQETLNQIQAQYASVSEDAAHTLKVITDGNSQVISDIRACIAELENNLTFSGNQQLSTNSQMLQDTVQHINKLLAGLLRDLTQQNLSIMQNASGDIFTHLNSYSQNLQDSMHVMEQARYDLQLKYDEFMQAMSTDSLRKIYQKIDRVEKSINLKFTLMFAGIGITALLVILSIFF